MTTGKTALGFLNPLLYQHPEVLTDITQGSNPGCGTNGFPAAQGWVRKRWREGVSRVFRRGRGRAGATLVMVLSACSPAMLHTMQHVHAA